MRRYNKFRSAWQHADSGALHWMRRAWDWLHTWAHPDEAMLARLWSARQGRSAPSGGAHAANEVRAIWTDYLRQQWRRHLVWLVVNGVIAPVLGAVCDLAWPQPDRLLVCLPSDPSLAGRLGDPTECGETRSRPSCIPSPPSICRSNATATASVGHAALDGRGDPARRTRGMAQLGRAARSRRASPPSPGATPAEPQPADYQS